jgi:hypothetical protein
VKSPEKVSKKEVFATFQTLLRIASIIAQGKCEPVGHTGRLYLHLRRNGNDSSFQANNTQTITRTHVLRGPSSIYFYRVAVTSDFFALFDIPNFSIRKLTL